MTSLSLLAGRTEAPSIPVIEPILTYRMESSEDPDQLASENQDDLELHCFQNRIHELSHEIYAQKSIYIPMLMYPTRLEVCMLVVPVFVVLAFQSKSSYAILLIA